MTSNASKLRASHANRDAPTRKRKARKIVALLESRRPLVRARLLEIGTGSGLIPVELAKAVGALGTVNSVEVVDEAVNPTNILLARCG